MSGRAAAFPQLQLITLRGIEHERLSGAMALETFGASQHERADRRADDVRAGRGEAGVTAHFKGHDIASLALEENQER